MATDSRIPIVVGVTGHRMLAQEVTERLYGQVRDALARLQTAYPNSPIRMLNSLAEGADSLCARAARDLAIPVDAPLPSPIADYRTDFSGDALIEFDRQIGEAERVFPAPPHGAGAGNGQPGRRLPAGGAVHRPALSRAVRPVGWKRAGARRLRHGGNR